MSSRAGGIGLGVVMGWLLGSAPLATSPIGGAATVGALASALATSTALAGPGAGLAFIVGLALAFFCRRAFERIPGRGGHS